LAVYSFNFQLHPQYLYKETSVFIYLAREREIIKMNEKWGIDLGGTKIEGVVLKSNDPEDILCRIRVGTEQEGGYEHIVSQVALLISKMKAETGLSPTKIGMGTPGTTDPVTGLLKNSNTTALNGMPLQKSLETAVRVPFIMSNDANCFAMAEAHLGAVTELDSTPQVVIGLILGTGVGSGIVVNGQVINGIHGIGGEWGHNTLIPDGDTCYCGKKGCVEKVIAGPSLEKYYQSKSGVKKKLKDIVTDARSGTDEHAKATIDRLLSYFGLAISSVINVLDPEVIVIGGGVGNIDELYDHGMEAALPYVFNPEIRTKLLKPKLGDSAGVFGAAMLV